MAEMIQPMEIEVRGKTYIISKFPALEGRDIIASYPGANLTQLKGGGQDALESVKKLMQYVAVKLDDGREIRLTSHDLINNHVPDWESLGLLEAKMLEYNCSFFQDGSVSTFLTALRTMDVAKITEMLTPLLGKLSQAAKLLYTN